MREWKLQYAILVPLFSKVIPRFGSSQFSPLADCTSSIVHTTAREKTRVDVKWTAPSTGSGCVSIKATVVEHLHIWYRDDGALTVTLCEGKDEPNPRKKLPLGRRRQHGHQQQQQHNQHRQQHRQHGGEDERRRQEAASSTSHHRPRVRVTSGADTNDQRRDQQQHYNRNQQRHRNEQQQQQHRHEQQQGRRGSNEVERAREESSPDWIDPLSFFRRNGNSDNGRGTTTARGKNEGRFTLTLKETERVVEERIRSIF